MVRVIRSEYANGAYTEKGADRRHDEFDRMVSAIEREAAARALEEAAEVVELDMGRGFTGSDDHIATANAEAWLRARAAEIREGSDR